MERRAGCRAGGEDGHCFGGCAEHVVTGRGRVSIDSRGGGGLGLVKKRYIDHAWGQGDREKVN